MAGGRELLGERIRLLLKPRRFCLELFVRTELRQLLEVRLRIDLQVPAELAEADGAEGQRRAVGFAAVVAAVQAAVEGDAMLHGEDVPGFVAGDLHGAEEAEAVGFVAFGRVAVAMNRPDADPLVEGGLAEDEV